MAASLHLVKLCVGVELPEELIAWQELRRSQTGRSHAFHVTRMWPRRADELLDGGSIFWVMKGEIKARQRVIRLDEVIGGDGIRRCAIILDDDVVKTERVVRRAFQGWRYFDPANAPRDLPRNRDLSEDGTKDECNIPDELAQALVEIGVR